MSQVFPFGPRRATALGPAPLAPLRAGPRPHRADAGRREHRLPGQPPAGRADPDLPRLQRVDPADRAAGPPAPRRSDRAQGRPVRPARAFEQLHRIARRPPRRAPPAAVPAGPGAVRRAPAHDRRRRVGARDGFAQRWTEMGVEVLQGYGATEMGPLVSFTRPARNGSARSASRSPASRSGSPTTARSWPAARAASPATGRTRGDRGGDRRRRLVPHRRPRRVHADGMLTFRGRKKDMLALPDGQKVYPEDVEAVLARRAGARRDRGRLAARPGPAGPRRAPARRPAAADAVVRTRTRTLGAHQQIRGSTVWPDEDLPRTHTLKVRKPDVLARLADRAPGSAASRRRRRPPARPRRRRRATR